MSRRSGRRQWAARGHILAVVSLLVVLLSLIQPALAANQEGSGDGTATVETPAVSIDPTQPVGVEPTVPDASDFQTTQQNDQPVVVTGTVDFAVLNPGGSSAIVDGYKLCLSGLECADIVGGYATVHDLAVGEHQYMIVRIDTGNAFEPETVNVAEVESPYPTEIVLPFTIAADAPTVEVTDITAASTDEVTPTSDEITPTSEVTPSTTVTAVVTPSKTSTATVSAITPTTAVTPTLPTTPTATATATKPVTATSTATKPATPTPTPGPGSGSVKGTNGAGLNCRATPSTSGTVITVLRDGTVVPYRGPAQNGWQPVTCAGKPGFISTQYVAKTPATPAPTAVPTKTSTPVTTATVTPTLNSGQITGTNGAGLNCRKSPSTSGVIITVIREGVTVPLRGPAQNGWQPVTCGGQPGFVSTAYLAPITTPPTAIPSGTVTPTPVPGGGSGVVSGTDGGGVNCRKGPDTSYAVITIVAEGTRVSFRGVAANGWQPVTCAGQAGYIYVLYLTGTASPGQGEFWLDVNLSTQYMTVYRGNTPVLGTYVSTGRPGFDTPTGTFHINSKIPSQTMSGVLGGEYYNVPNVPYVMYFTDRGHAIHGAYWHNNFGHVMSHGCVNLPLDVAAWVYSQASIGTRVQIHW